MPDLDLADHAGAFRGAAAFGTDLDHTELSRLNETITAQSDPVS
jgi:hypothetical protein